jgi:uncharacterized membrane protein (DUF106 family)
MEHTKTADEITTQAASPELSEVGMKITDVIVSSGLIEQYGPELGISGAVIVALIGIYWKYRKGGSISQEDLEKIIHAIADKKTEETKKPEEPEEVEDLKKINEEAENKNSEK